jgi:hypothetical protein
MRHKKRDRETKTERQRDRGRLGITSEVVRFGKTNYSRG